MASSYAALVSLLNVLNRVKHPTCPATFDKSQLKALSDRANLLVDFLETHSQYISNDLQRKITDAANGAQDRIESFVVVRIHERRAGKGVDLRLQYVTMDLLENDIQRMDLIIQEAKEVEQDQQPRRIMHVGSSQPLSGTLKFVGFKAEENRLLEQLASNKSSREVIPVVGMGGIGKSTLAVSVYNLPYVRDNFDVKAWVTISQVYDIGTIIFRLLHEFDIHDIPDEQLGVQLHKYLFGRKYLVVLDDIWDTEAWDAISRFLPDNNNGSRVLLTTRLLDVARSVGSVCAYEMQLLDDDKSWDLLSKVVFGQEVCLSELETTGRRIATGCKGLPLSVVVIGGMLKLHDKTLEYWEGVAENIRSIIGTGNDEHCLKILSLSYQEMPIHLKPCFLYMASYPEDYVIRVSELTRLWIADGFLKQSTDKSSEEVALEYLDNLVKRSIVIVKWRGSRGSMKNVILHDLVRELCIREAQKEMFLSVYDDVINVPDVIQSGRRLAFQKKHHLTSLPASEPRGPVQSFLWFRSQMEPPNISWLSLLRVAFSSRLAFTDDVFMRLVNLRLVKSSCRELLLYHPNAWSSDRMPRLISPISFMWNLETIIIDDGRRTHSVPLEIWMLPHIKHIILYGVSFPDPPAHGDFVLGSLQTLKKVIFSSNKVLYRIPNIKDLGIMSMDDFGSNELPGSLNFVHCHKLETLYLEGRISSASGELNTIKLFPDSLTKLTLYKCHIQWERMTVVGSLPSLQVLKLEYDAFTGKEWSSLEGEFQSLKVLSIVACSLETWSVDNSSHFPCLEHLSLKGMYSLDKVPQVFADSMTLKSIRMDNCDYSSVKSAKNILEEQADMGNDDLTVEARCCNVDNEEQEAEVKSWASERFHVPNVSRSIEWLMR